MTQHEAELLAQFASTWIGVRGDTGKRAMLRLDLCKFFEDFCLNFDKVSYWTMCEKLDASDRAQGVKR